MLAASFALPGAPARAGDGRAGEVRGEVPDPVRPQASHVELQTPDGRLSAIAGVADDGSFVFAKVTEGSYYAVVVDAARAGLAQSRVVVSAHARVHFTVFDGLCGVGTTFVEGPALDVMPELARRYGPHTIWGWAPGLKRAAARAAASGAVPSEAAASGAGSPSALRAVLRRVDGKDLAAVPVGDDGAFAFTDVTNGEYYVAVVDGPSQERARSWRISFARGTSRMAVFAESCAALAPRTTGSQSGPTRAGLLGASVAAAAAATGFTLAISERGSPAPESGSR